MNETLDLKGLRNPLNMGVRLLEGHEADTVDLGPLKKLQGTWVGNGFDGWNVISVPGPLASGGPGGFILEVIPYEETLTFTPVVQAGNRGTFDNFKQSEQQITGFVYEQRITSVCNIPRCVEMGFGAGMEIHVETGLLLYIKDCVKDQQSTDTTCGDAVSNIARLATIPHGNSVLAMGSAIMNVPNPGNDFFKPASTLPVPVNKGDRFQLGYNNVYSFPKLFDQFEQSNPNSFLKQTLLDRKQVITSMDVIEMSSKTPTGGIHNIPFGDTVVKAVDMDATFWIESIQGQEQLQLQYSQTINLQFPGLSDKLKPIQVLWPHVTISTLTKIKD